MTAGMGLDMAPIAVQNNASVAITVVTLSGLQVISAVLLRVHCLVRGARGIGVQVEELAGRRRRYTGAAA